MSKTTPIDLGAYLRSKGSPLADHVSDIYASANRWRIDPRLIVAISGGETSFGTNGSGPKAFNAWGIGPGRSYGSWTAGIDAAAKLLREGYVGQGLTSLSAIQRKWAPVGASNDPRNMNSTWLRNNGTFYADLGGDPNNVTRDWRKASSPKVVPTPIPAANVTTLSSPRLGSTQIDSTDPALQSLLDIARGKKATTSLQDLARSVGMNPPKQPQQQGTDVYLPPRPAPTPSPTVPGTPKAWTPGWPIVGGSRGGGHETSGLAGYPAFDYFAPAGAAAVAPVSGKVIRFSGHDPRQGAVQGAGGPLGWSLYIQGNDGRTYYLTHLGSRSVKVGQAVRAGQQIGTVANYDKYGRQSHIHMGVSG